MLQFDDATRNILDKAYSGEDVRRRRQASLDALSPAPGEVIVDMGCGDGRMTVDLADAVGDAGQVLGVDPSDAMLAAAHRLCEGRGNVTLSSGNADASGLKDAVADGYVSLQVWEYIADFAPTIAETWRILKPGGRIAVGDMHFDTWAWNSSDPDRMRRMMDSWDTHLATRDLASHLTGALTEGGFQVTDMVAVPFASNRLRPDGLDTMMIHLMHRHALANNHIDQSEADAWKADLEALAEKGQYFFSITHFVFVAKKIGG